MLGAVTADLAVAFDGHGAFFQIHALEHGTFAEAFLNIQGSLLQPFFLFRILVMNDTIIIRDIK